MIFRHYAKHFTGMTLFNPLTSHKAGAILIPILEMRTLRLKEVRSSAKVTQPVRKEPGFWIQSFLPWPLLPTGGSSFWSLLHFKQQQSKKTFEIFILLNVSWRFVVSLEDFKSCLAHDSNTWANVFLVSSVALPASRAKYFDASVPWE